MAKQIGQGVAMHLSTSNRILEDTLRSVIFCPLEKRNSITIDLLKSFHDFDDVAYRVHSPVNPESGVPDLLHIVRISFSHPQYAELMKFGGQATVNELFGKYVYPQTESPFNLTLQLDLDELASLSNEEKEALIIRIAEMKRSICGAPLELAFSHSAKKELLPEPIVLNVGSSGGDLMLIKPRPDSTLVVYTVSYSDKTDEAIAEVFFREFLEAKRSVGNGPSIFFSTEPPTDLEGTPLAGKAGTVMGFVSIVLFSQHIGTPETRIKAVTLVQQFRTYLQYHIKAAKAYMHARMRKRVAGWMQVMSDAAPDKPMAVGTRTITGRHWAGAKK